MDIRIQPEVTTTTIAGVEVRVSALLLGGVPRGAAVVVAGPDGLNDTAAVDTMNSLAQHGYESVLAEPQGPMPDDTASAVVDHLVKQMAARGWTHDQTGVVGHGQGARTALLAAAESSFGAAVSIPRDGRQLLVPERITELRTPWLGLVGCGPGNELGGELDVYRSEVRDASTDHSSLIGYRGVDHCLQISAEALEHAAAFDAWQRTVEWLNIHVAPRPTPLAEAWRARQQSMPPVSS